MPTERLYYTDSYTTAFEARLLEQTTHAGSPAAVLDRSYFYPTSGGQPHDTGLLNQVPVVGVEVREADGAVLHLLDSPLSSQAGDVVRGQIDWARRFDHMQHHTGQHVLTQAFVRVASAETVGFHLSSETVTIDLDKPGITPARVDAAEDLANQIVYENRPVRIWFPAPEEIPALPLRKMPEVSGKLRVVSIEDFDVTACGGTHVAQTGAIGPIKVLRVEKRGDIARVEFCCGGRALGDYHQKHALLSQLAAALTTSYSEIPAVFEKLREENKALRRDLRAVRAELAERDAEALWLAAPAEDGLKLIALASEDRDLDEVRLMLQRLISHPATVALCGVAGEKAMLLLARSDDLPFDMIAALKQALAVWGIDRGGGRPAYAQGGGVPATRAQVQAALEAAATAIRAAHTRFTPR